MPVPSPYQVVLLGQTRPAVRDALRKTLVARMREMDLDVDAHVVFLDASDARALTQAGPAVCAFVGGHFYDAMDSATVAWLVDDAVLVLPLVESLDGYENQVPSPLWPINGKVLSDTAEDIESAVGLIMEGLGLLRRTRRLFISYRRTEASDAAHQLYDLLDDRGFDVFLDTRKVRPGDPFQEELLHRLSDSDVLIILDTDGFLESEWTREELAQAQAMALGVLQVQWPGVGRPAYAALCTVVPLGAADLDGKRLTDDALHRIGYQTETLRARSIAARYTSLVGDFDAIAEQEGIPSTVQPTRYLELAPPGKNPVAVIPTVGVPETLSYQDIEALLSRLASDGSAAPSRAVILYDPVPVRPRWKRHLDWLDGHLPVQTVTVSGAEAWLRSL